METFDQNTDERLPLPIVILSFNRPAYLRQVLASLKPQIVRNDEIYLFQDGSWNDFSRRNKCKKQAIAECLDIFNEYFPGAKIFPSPTNLGIAGNYRRAEKYVFDTLKKDYALFLEDDLVLGDNYLLVISDLLKLALRNPRIGYVSAYGNMWATLEEQEILPGKLIQMHENWGAAFTRTSWEAQKNIREKYWDLIHDCDYSQRDHCAIVNFYKDLGFNCIQTSQDASRWVATLAAQMVRLTTATCQARYIGALGEHSDRTFYELHRFNKSVFSPKRPPVAMPADWEIEQWLQNDRDNFNNGYRHSYLSNPPALAGWLGRASARERQNGFGAVLRAVATGPLPPARTPETRWQWRTARLRGKIFAALEGQPHLSGLAQFTLRIYRHCTRRGRT
jgi:glycosyltransferase involved in cell wall biosynthesis